MEDLRQRCQALPEPYRADGLKLWEEARSLTMMYTQQRALAQIRFDLSYDIGWLETSAAIHSGGERE